VSHGQPLDGSAAPRGARQPIPRLPPDGDLPLSFIQERNYATQQQAPNSPFYTTAMHWRLRGPLDAANLERALAEFVRRHEAMRTIFVSVGGRPAARVSAHVPFGLARVDLKPATEEELMRQLIEDSQHLFDLERGPLARAVLFRLSDHDHGLAWTTHQIVFDGRSADILSREVGALYDAFSARADYPLTAPELQASSYTRWVRGQLHESLLEQQLADWRRRLEGASWSSPPADHPATTSEDRLMPARVYDLILPRSWFDQVVEFGRAEGHSAFMTLLAGYQVVFQRLTGRDEFFGGTWGDGRVNEAANTVGQYLTVLPLRTDLSGDPSFRELVGRVGAAMRNVYDYQTLPFWRILTRNSFSGAFFQCREPIPLSLAGLKVDEIELPTASQQLTRFDFELRMLASVRELLLSVRFNAARYEEATIAAILRRMKAAVEEGVASPDRPISTLSFNSGSPDA
jgi:hypothetical protein